MSDLRTAPTHTALLIGLMTFGLFFGAGNLIFPVELGRLAGPNATVTGAGFLVTAVGIPIVAIISSAVSGCSSVHDMTSRVSPTYATIFTCLLYLTIGPAFAIPRTATVSYEVGVAPVLHSDGVALPIFTVAFFTLALVAALKPGKLMDWVGRYLTPLFLALLAILIAATLIYPMPTTARPPEPPYDHQVFMRGFLDGYNTMDALASLAFAIVIVEAINRRGLTSRHDVTRMTIRAGLIAAIPLTLVYVSLAWLGRTSTVAVPHADNGGAVLAGVSRHYYGAAGQALIAAIVLVACLKTAIGLIVACAEIFRRMFPAGPSVRLWVVIFSVGSAVIANAGLTTIIAWSTPVLMFLYPLAITTIILGLLDPWLGSSRIPHRVMTGCVVLAALPDLARSLPVQGAATRAMTRAADAILPWASDGLGWALPAIIGLAVGWAVSLVSGRSRRWGTSS
ncbi:branched-chain amino acid transport system II carrier protein [Cutibacterium sp. WCA-380-WT-3A]|uniref:Branched-chain amino acid transport system II carrier protein n=1 Tax=Cutibacterium porci TaxID=2605781 RepID=A0A7K0J8H0_9ACTN|nr:branched-chain amino acid transport system II carrier protein [Cutibacterium porci]MSS46256.1 branched-chain amino acid transport system II carrier protein [Cutibacterium porci]